MKFAKELLDLTLGVLLALAWIFWRLRLVTVPALLVVLALNLSGCNSARKLARSEGAGFTNTGRHAPPACLISRGFVNGVKVVRWGDCPKARR